MTDSGLGRLRAYRFLRAAVMAALLVGGVPAYAASSDTAAPVCTGRDLFSQMPPDMAAAIDRSVAETPYAHGRLWRATKDGAEILIAGTYHFPDPRHSATVDALRPYLSRAAALLVEAGLEEERRLTERLAADPSLMADTTGPTLPERLDPETWVQLSKAMAERGMPAVMSSRLRPWYVSMMLGMSPCMIRQMRQAGDVGGLDHMLIAAAGETDIPIRAVEPWDTMFTLFADMTPADEVDMLRAALPAAREADDYAHTTTEAYFAGDIWKIWEFGRQDAYRASGLSRAAVDRQLALVQDKVMDARNRAWIAPVTQAATQAAVAGKPVVLAVGALHLPGAQGIPRLLEQNGWTVTEWAP